jgi:hypothetical protein
MFDHHTAPTRARLKNDAAEGERVHESRKAPLRTVPPSADGPCGPYGPSRTHIRVMSRASKVLSLNHGFLAFLRMLLKWGSSNAELPWLALSAVVDPCVPCGVKDRSENPGLRTVVTNKLAWKPKTQHFLCSATAVLLEKCVCLGRVPAALFLAGTITA